MKLENLFHILKTQTTYPLLRVRFQEAEAISRWPLAVGEHIAKHTRPIRVQDSVLWVEVDSPPWKHQLLYMKKQVLDVLNGRVQAAQHLPAPKEILKDLYYIEPRLSPNPSERNPQHSRRTFRPHR